MKPIVIVGIVLAVFGAVIVFTGGFGFGSQRSVMRVGDLQVSAEEQRVVPAWVGGVAIVGGLLLVGTGVRQRSAR
jgi:drug/metabolite transporter (DMT)-like permease